MLEISRVAHGSVGDEIGICKGDMLVSFNGYPVVDELDYIFYDANRQFTIEVMQQGTVSRCEIEKDENESLGLFFCETERQETVCCTNACVFCFVDQLPKGLRKSLYIKDDDDRSSFLYGNYLTLTNVSDDELQRIIRLNISPLYVSIHATDPKVRTDLMKNPRAAQIMKQLALLNKGNISLHCQIVLCPNYNDGMVLKKTLQDLAVFSNIKSVAVVPVGLTKHRFTCTPLVAVDQSTAQNSIEICNTIAAMRKNFCYLSDEMYLIAKQPLPSYKSYGAFTQLENGVGLIRHFERQVMESLLGLKTDIKREIAVVTGVAATPFMTDICARIMLQLTGIKLQVIPIINRTFGESIHVVGLLTGADLIETLQHLPLPERVIIPKVMLKEFETYFLDDVTISDLEQKIQRKVIVSEMTGDGFLQAILNK